MSNKMALDALTAILKANERMHNGSAVKSWNGFQNGDGEDAGTRFQSALNNARAAIAALQAEPQPEHERNAARLAFMQEQMLAADFDYQGECVLVFQWPRDVPVGADLIRNIDAALLATPPKD